MLRSARARTVAIIAGGLLGGSAILGAIAGPWTDSDPGGGPSGLEETPTATSTPDGTPDPTATAEATVESQQYDGLGVPTDSPACTTENHDPNPHDTDGDGDGCREVETEDGMKNLPDPAVDAQDGNSGLIGQGDENGPGALGDRTPGPPEGDPAHGNAYGHATATPTPTP